jgi:ribosomal protein L11 methylase PrmA
MAPLLIAERDRILNRLASGGTLILAGILATEFATVCDRYESTGLQLFAEKTEREWQSGAFKRVE